jgi:hypothetical protein
MFGPAVRPPMPAEAVFPTDVGKIGQPWDEHAVDGPATWRRSVYILARRSNPFHLLQAFDFPATTVSCAERTRTTVPTQALVLLNDPFVISQARRVARQAAWVPGGPVRGAYRLILSRDPTPAEAERAARLAAGPHGLVDMCHALLMSNEFAYVD